MANARRVVFVSNHQDTAELYALALEAAGFSVECASDTAAALAVMGPTTPVAVVVHVLPRNDPAAIGALLRQGRPGTVLIGLFSIQLPVATLAAVLKFFDDVVLIPCAPDALVSRVVRLEEMKRRQESA